MGAKRVIVRGQGHMTMEMAIELPADKPSRDKILRWANNFYGLTRGTGANMIKDEGQSWISVRPGMGG